MKTEGIKVCPGSESHQREKKKKKRRKKKDKVALSQMSSSPQYSTQGDKDDLGQNSRLAVDIDDDEWEQAFLLDSQASLSPSAGLSLTYDDASMQDAQPLLSQSMADPVVESDSAIGSRVEGTPPQGSQNNESPSPSVPADSAPSTSQGQRRSEPRSLSSAKKAPVQPPASAGSARVSRSPRKSRLSMCVPPAPDFASVEDSEGSSADDPSPMASPAKSQATPGKRRSKQRSLFSNDKHSVEFTPASAAAPSAKRRRSRDPCPPPAPDFASVQSEEGESPGKSVEGASPGKSEEGESPGKSEGGESPGKSEVGASPGKSNSPESKEGQSGGTTKRKKLVELIPINDLLDAADSDIYKKSSFPHLLRPSALAKEDSKAARDPKLRARMLASILPVPVSVPDKAHFPLTRRVVKWILEHDFPLPKLQTECGNWTARLGGDVLRRLKVKYPYFRSGCFSWQEEAVLCKRMNQLLVEVGIEADQGMELIKELERCKNSVQTNQHLCKTIVGAYVGRPFLRYRIIHNLFEKLVNICYRYRSAASGVDPKRAFIDAVESKKRNIKEYLESKGRSSRGFLDQARKELGLEGVVTTEQLRNSFRQRELEVSGPLLGPFGLADSSLLMQLVLEQRQSTDLDQLRTALINWEPIAKEMDRTVRSVRRHWDGILWPACKKYQEEPDYLSDPWCLRSTRRRLIGVLRKRAFPTALLIRWADVESYFLSETSLSLREIFHRLYRPYRQRNLELCVALDRMDMAEEELEEVTTGDKRALKLRTQYVEAFLEQLERFKEGGASRSGGE